MTLLYVGSAWLAGLLFASILSPSVPLILAGLSIAVIALFLWHRERLSRLIVVCLLAFLAASLRYVLATPRFAEDSIVHYNEQGPVRMRGVVVGEPDIRPSYINLQVEVCTLEMRGRLRSVKGKVLVRAPRYPEYVYGDEVEVEGFLQTPPSGEGFSYRDYLAHKGIYSLVRSPYIRLLSRGKGHPFYSALYSLKAYLLQTLHRLFHEPEASLLAGILLGLDKGIPPRLMEDFSVTGTTHIIAISGFNITVIAGVLSGLAHRLLGRRWAVPLVVGGLALYTLLVGADASVVRAAIMGSLYLIARNLGRQAYSLNSLMAAAVLMTLVNPFLLWDVGFQLSFAATVGLIVYTPLLQRWTEGLLARTSLGEAGRKGLRFLQEPLLVTLAAQVTTLPLVLHYFGRLSLVFVPVNLLILPAQPGVMIWGGLAVLAGALWLPLGYVPAWVGWLFTTYTIRIVQLFAHLPHASVSVGPFPFLGVWLWWGLLACHLWMRGREPALRRRLLALVPTGTVLSVLAFLVLLAWMAVWTLPDGRLHVLFLSADEGLVLIRTPGGRRVLLGGGRDASAIIASLGRRLPFWERNIDVLVPLRPSDSYLAGLVPLLERYRVGAILEPEGRAHGPARQRWEALKEAGRVPVYRAQPGMRLRLDKGVELVVLDVSRRGALLLRLEMGWASFLLAGGLEKEAEWEDVEAHEEGPATVLWLGGLGSAFLEPSVVRAVEPRLLLVTEPSAYGEEARRNVLCIRELGGIELVTDGRRLWVEAGR